MMRLTKAGYGYTLGGKQKPKIPCIDHTHEWDDCPDILGHEAVVSTKLFRLMRLNQTLGPEPVHIEFS